VVIVSTRVIHDRFCCNRQSTALARETLFVKREAREPAGLSCLFGLFGLFG